MMYTIDDLVSEYTSIYCNKQREQKFEKLNFELIHNASFTLDLWVKDILSLNRVLRVESDSLYKVHKSYPSPRSLYPIQIFVCIEEKTYVSTDPFHEKYIYYSNNSRKDQIGDILLNINDIYLINYISLKKTLALLECGHLLYNIAYIALKYGISYKIIDHESKCVKLQYLNQKICTDYMKLVERDKSLFMNKVYHRSSGPFNRPFTTFKSHFKKDLIGPQENIFNYLINLMDLNEVSLITQLRVFTNNGNGIFSEISGNRILKYNHINELYPYINFFGVDQLVILMIDDTRLKSINLEKLLLYSGMLAQNICIANSDQNYYNRPVKSLDFFKLKQLLHIEKDVWTPFYCIISGSIKAIKS